MTTAELLTNLDADFAATIAPVSACRNALPENSRKALLMQDDISDICEGFNAARNAIQAGKFSIATRHINAAKARAASLLT